MILQVSNDSTLLSVESIKSCFLSSQKRLATFRANLMLLFLEFLAFVAQYMLHF